jgi:hypothetical protein
MTTLTYAAQFAAVIWLAYKLARNLPAIVLAVIDSERGRR